MEISPLVQNVLTPLGTTAGVAFGLGWVGRLAVKRYFDAGVELLKAELKRTNELELTEVRNEFTLRLAQEKERATDARIRLTQSVADEGATRERIRAEVVAWATPVLHAVTSLEDRLRNILESDGYLALSRSPLQLNPNWSVTYDYFLNSTLYLFGQYFCWIYLFEQEMSFELIQLRDVNARLSKAVESVGRALGGFPSDPPHTGLGKDLQVFRLQQQAMGEVLVAERGDRRACVGFAAFRRRLRTGRYDSHFDATRELIDGIQPGQKRWERLQSTLTATTEVRSACDAVLRIPAESVI